LQEWDLDGLGNWSSFDDDGTVQTRATNSANEITSTTGLASPAYDRAGNMIETPKPGDPANEWAVTFDAWNRVVEVTDGTTTVSYEYDGQGRRIERVSGSTEQHFYYDGEQVVEVRQPDGLGALEPVTQYVWSLRYVDSPILRDSFSGGTLVPADRLYYLTDANHNVTAVVDIAGDVQERYDYDAYGRFTIYDANWSNPGTASAVDNTLLFAGQDLDTDTGLQYSRARWYNASLGSFISRDPLGFDAGDANLYRYVFNSPANHTDPSGQFVPVAGALIAASAVVLAKDIAAIALLMRGERVPCNLLITSPQFWGDVLMAAAMGGLLSTGTVAANIAGGALGLGGAAQGLNAAMGEAARGNHGSAALHAGLAGVDFALGLSGLSAAAKALFPAGSAIGNFMRTDFGSAGFGARGSAEAAVPSANASRPVNLSPPGAGRRGAFRQAKFDMGIPRSQQPTAVRTVPDRTNPGKTVREFDFDVPSPDGGSVRRVTIRDDRNGHRYLDNPTQNRGPHFNTPNNGHYDY
jgi:RHS repeat-associated protein